MKRRLVTMVLALAAVIAVIRYADFTTLWSAIVGMPRTALLLLVGLLAAGALVKAARWTFYLRSADLNVSWSAGLTSYLAGMSATALPGGSLLSARLAQEHGDVKMRQAAPAIFVSLVADAIAISSLALVMTAVTHQERGRYVIPIIGLLMSVVFVTMGRSGRVWRFVDRLLARFRPTRGWLPKEADVHARVAAMMRTTVLLRGVALSIVTTLISIVFLIVLVNALTVRGIRPLEAATVHSTAETVGVVLPIGFGLSISDSSLAGLLNSLGIGWVRVMFIVLAMRSLNTLFRTVAGTLTLVIFYHGLLRETLAIERRTRRVRRGARSAGRRVSAGTVHVAYACRRMRHRPRPVGEALSLPLQAALLHAGPRRLVRNRAPVAQLSTISQHPYASGSQSDD